MRPVQIRTVIIQILIQETGCDTGLHHLDRRTENKFTGVEIVFQRRLPDHAVFIHSVINSAVVGTFFHCNTREISAAGNSAAIEHRVRNTAVRLILAECNRLDRTCCQEIGICISHSHIGRERGVSCTDRNVRCPYVVRSEICHFITGTVHRIELGLSLAGIHRRRNKSARGPHECRCQLLFLRFRVIPVPCRQAAGVEIREVDVSVFVPDNIMERLIDTEYGYRAFRADAVVRVGGRCNHRRSGCYCRDHTVLIDHRDRGIAGGPVDGAVFCCQRKHFDDQVCCVSFVKIQT